jgi:hypothetical protein
VFYEDPFVPLIVAIIAVIFLAIPIDAIIQGSEEIMETTPKLPNTYGTAFTYLLTISISYALVWDAGFDFFRYVNLEFTPWVGFLMTAIMVGAGTKVLRDRFDLMSLIPVGVIGGLKSTMLRIGSVPPNSMSSNYAPQPVQQSAQPVAATQTIEQSNNTSSLATYYNKV